MESMYMELTFRIYNSESNLDNNLTKIITYLLTSYLYIVLYLLQLSDAFKESGNLSHLTILPLIKSRM